VTGVDHSLEGTVRAEMRRLQPRPERSKARPHWPPLLARSAHRGGPVAAVDVDPVGGGVLVMRRAAAWLYAVGAALVGLLVVRRRDARQLATPGFQDEPEVPR
jgi:hypothetical protein